MFLILAFMFYLLQNQRTEGGTGSAGWEEGGGGERGKRMNTVQITYKHVCKCKNDTY
jgi:hypothetical protein